MGSRFVAQQLRLKGFHSFIPLPLSPRFARKYSQHQLFRYLVFIYYYSHIEAKEK